MATSIHEGPIACQTTQLDPRDPLDTDHARTIINNAQHYADSAGQVLVDFPAITGRSLTNIEDAVSTWYRISAFGPFALRIRSDGTPYPIRVRIAGHAATANTVKLGLALAPDDTDSERVELIREGANTTSATTASTTVAWLTAGTTLLTLTAAQADAMSQTLHTIDAVAGDPISVRVVVCRVAVWAQYTGTKVTAHLDALYAAEYVGV